MGRLGLGLGVNRRGLAAQRLLAVVSRLALLASGYWELIPQGVERPGRETEPSLPLSDLVKTAWVVCVEGGRRVGLEARLRRRI